MTSTLSPSFSHVFPLPHAIATATDRSPVSVLPSPSDPFLQSDLARMKAARIADLISHPTSDLIKDGVFVLGTRTSKLAMVQTELVKRELERIWPGREIRISGMLSAGDKNQSQPLYLLGGKALWTKELEVALLEGACDAIVHSLKDVPTTFPEGCELGAILKREDPSDALVVKAGLSYKSLEEMPDGSIIGTSSVRRVAQLRRKFPKLKFADVRGNLNTRLRKLDDPNGTPNYTALILASAGLIRLSMQNRITASVTSPTLYHAVGQGAIAIEIREGDLSAATLVGALEDWKTGWTTRAERAMLRVLEGGCSVPVGCETRLVEEKTKCPVMITGLALEGVPNPHVDPKTQRPSSPYDQHSATLTLTGTITSLAGTSSVLATSTRLVHSIEEAEALGSDIANELIKGGGREILEELGKHVKEVGGEEGAEIPFESNRALSIPIPIVGRNYGMDDPEESSALEANDSLVQSPKSPTSPFGSLKGRSRHGSLTYPGEVCLRPSGW